MGIIEYTLQCLAQLLLLSLDGLPFPPNHFDLVRIVGIGMGVPEDEVGQVHMLFLFFPLLTRRQIS